MRPRTNQKTNWECRFCEADNMTAQEAADHRQEMTHEVRFKTTFRLGKVGGHKKAKFKDPWEGSIARE